MKFKTIFILFNIVIVVSFLVIYFMPLIMLGWDYTAVFWKNNWFLPLIFLAVLALLNIYFLSNWRLFQLLESEDWERLTVYLEERVFTRKKIQAQHVKLLINAYLIRSKIEKICELESFIRKERPAALPKFALQFGVPYLLKNDGEKMERYFFEFIDSTRGEENNWIRWNYAFALLLQQKREEAKEILNTTIENAGEPVLQLLTAHLLEVFNDDPDVRQKVDRARDRLRGRYSRPQWDNEVAKSKNNIEVVVLSKLLEDATEKLFSRKAETSNSSGSMEAGKSSPSSDHDDDDKTEGWNEIH